MKITTESGATYLIDGSHLCTKIDHEGFTYSPFKIWGMKAIDPELVDGKDMDTVCAVIDDTPSGKPEVGKRLFVAGRDKWWISTVVVSIDD